MFRFVILAAMISLSGFADDYEQEEICPDGKRHYRAAVRHIESGGIGYDNGYTTLEVFLASDPSQRSITPFLDIRGHVFDNGKWAVNTGIGLRALWGNRIYGINTYYDYRSTGRLHSNQVGAGLEVLGRLFDFRINGYLPVGAKTSAPYGSAFQSFSGNYMLVSEKFHSAMKGANAEFGFHFGESKSLDFYAAAGPYYFIGEVAPVTWGGKARISGTFKDTLIVEISDSYDRVFHNKFQGQIGLSFSFGPKSKIKKEERTCKLANTLNNRMLQPVDRQEIIVVDNTKKNTIAIDPATNLPYFFVFVDNTSNSNGTYESPYHSFAQAESNSSPNDIIYVFPGDGTTTGMNSGIALKANQKLWGSGINQLLQTSQGTISIPSQTSTSPTITNTNIHTELNAVTLATNNMISGLTITSSLNDAIHGTDPQSLIVSSCTIENTTRYAIDATCSNDASISITNNQFLNNTNGVNLTLSGASTIVCSDNTFEGQTSISNAPLGISATSNVLNAQIENNIFNENETGSIQCSLITAIEANLNVLNNTITNNDIGARGSIGSSVVILPTGTTNTCSLLLQGNTFSNNTSHALYLDTSGALTTFEATVSENTVSNTGGSTIVLATSIDTLTLLATNNTITQSNDNGISVVNTTHTTTTGTITINNNTITHIGHLSNGIAISQDFSTLNLIIQNNEIDNCEGTGILSYAPTGIDSLTMDISDNTISNCQNMSSNAASGIDIEQYTSLAGSVTNNTLLDNAGTAVVIGSTLSTPTVCLTLSGNNSTDYLLTNPGDGLFNLSPCNVDEVNIGTINTSGTIDLVQSCPEAIPCAP
jgi:hypothetical protein